MKARLEPQYLVVAVSLDPRCRGLVTSSKIPRISWESEVCGKELGGTGGIEGERSGERWGGLFRGEHHYSLDDKGRIVLPQTFRAALGRRVVVTRGLDECVAVYAPQEWARNEKKLRGLSVSRRDFVRFVLASAEDVELDRQALEQASRRLERFGGAVTLIRENFAAIRAVLVSQGIDRVDGVLFDLGASTMQFADPQRGFSFSVAGPLDMRMDRRQHMTAAELVNGLAERDLADLIWRYGEERWSRRIARGIGRARPLATTVDLAEVVRRAIPRRAWPRTIHPATRTFQALRIAVNDELSNLENAIPAAAEVLREAGRLCAITFHSLEDRTIKHTFLRLSRGCTRSSGSSACTNGGKRWLRGLTKKPITPTPEEIERNPRARSAKLRAAERLLDPDVGKLAR